MSTVKTRKRTRTEKQRRVWSPFEVNLILDYLKNVILAGKEIEKPNTKSFYKKMMEHVQLENCDVNSIINKMRSLKKTYYAAIKWRNETGQGVTEEGDIRAAIHNICEQFEALDEIFGSKEAGNDLYESETTVIGSAQFSVPQNYENEDLDNSDENPADKDDGIQIEKSCSSFGPLTKKLKKEPSEFAVMVQKRQEVQLADIKLNEDKIFLEKEKLDFQKEISIREVNVEERKCSIQEMSLKADAEFRREKLYFKREKYFKDKEFELEKFKIEQETKLKIELAKLHQVNN